MQQRSICQQRQCERKGPLGGSAYLAADRYALLKQQLRLREVALEHRHGSCCQQRHRSCRRPRTGAWLRQHLLTPVAPFAILITRSPERHE